MVSHPQEGTGSSEPAFGGQGGCRTPLRGWISLQPPHYQHWGETGGCPPFLPLTPLSGRCWGGKDRVSGCPPRQSDVCRGGGLNALSAGETEARSAGLQDKDKGRGCSATQCWGHPGWRHSAPPATPPIPGTAALSPPAASVSPQPRWGHATRPLSSATAVNGSLFVTPSPPCPLPPPRCLFFPCTITGIYVAGGSGYPRARSLSPHRLGGTTVTLGPLLEVVTRAPRTPIPPRWVNSQLRPSLGRLFGVLCPPPGIWEMLKLGDWVVKASETLITAIKLLMAFINQLRHQK